MNHPSSKQITTYFQTESQELSTLFAKLKELQELNQQVTSHLPPNLRSYCQVANVVKNKLILLAANGAVATQLRFQAPDLLKNLHQNKKLHYIHTIEYKVRPAPSILRETSPPQGPMQPLSTETIGLLLETAETLDCPKLKDIMRRIANRFILKPQPK